MAMPKKGRRKIVVDDVVHFYMIKPYVFGNDSDCGGNLTVEMSDGSYKSKKYQEAITPAMVEAFVRDNS